MTSEHEFGDPVERIPEVLEFVINDDGAAALKLGPDNTHEDLLLTLNFLGNSEERIQMMLDNILRSGINKLDLFSGVNFTLNPWEDKMPDNVQTSATLSLSPEATYEEVVHAFTQIYGDRESAKSEMRSMLMGVIDAGILCGIELRAEIRNPMLIDTEDDIAAEMAALSAKFLNDD